MLPDDASEASKNIKNEQILKMRSVAKTAEKEYLHALVRFQYGAEGVSSLPEAEGFSLVPPELKKKLEAKKKEEEKHKINEAAKLLKEEQAFKARELYGSGQNRFKSAYRHRYNPYSGAGFTPNWFVPFTAPAPAVPQLQYPTFPPVQDPAASTLPVASYPALQYFKPKYNAARSSAQAEHIQEQKKNSRCGRCNQWGHWHNDGVCDPADVARKLAQFKLQDPQMFAAAQASALRLEQAPPPPGSSLGT